MTQEYRIEGTKNLSPAQILVFGFAAVIFIGAILLTLPISSRDGHALPFLDALFTSTSATCVTGLVVRDTATQFSLFGQLVMLSLIQIGGLGFMVISTIIAVILGRRINLRERLIIKEALNQISLSGMVALVRQVVILTLSIEMTGALLLSLRFVPQFGWARGLYYGLFHSVSSFNNAGFDLMGGFRSLTGYVTDPLVSLTVAFLIILGGLGFTVMAELLRTHRFRELTLHTKLVMVTTGVLLAAGTLLFLILEWTNAKTIGGLPLGGKVLASFFQSVTPRTAGYNTVPIGDMRAASLFIMVILMFIGASPASTGGGVKTSTIAALTAAVWSTVRGSEDVNVFRRKLPTDIIIRSLAIVMISLALLVTLTVVMATFEPYAFIRILFETTSAFGTVGLTTGITPDVTPLSKIILIILMYSGRVGPMTLAAAMAQRSQKSALKYPEGRIIVG